MHCKRVPARDPERRDEAATAAVPWPNWAWAVVALLIAAMLRDPWSPDEPRYSALSRAVSEGHWIVLDLCGQPYADKPPLTFWLGGAMFSLFGERAWAQRLPVLIATVWTARMLSQAIAPVLGGERAHRAALLFLTMALPAWLGSRVQIDPALCLSVTAIGCSLWRMKSLRPRAFAIVTVWTAVATLTKGPVALVWIAWIALLVLALGRRDQRVSRWLVLAVGAVVGTVPLIAWARAVSARAPSLADTLWYDGHLGRVLEAQSHPGPIWEPGVELLVFALPWTPWVILGLRQAWREGHARLCIAGVVAPVLMFSLFAEKRPHYLLPIYPVLAVFAARASEEIPRRMIRAWLAVLVLGSAVAFPIADSFKTPRHLTEAVEDLAPQHDIPCLGVRPEGPYFLSGLPFRPDPEGELFERLLAEQRSEFIALVARERAAHLPPSLDRETRVFATYKVGSRSVEIHVAR